MNIKLENYQKKTCCRKLATSSTLIDGAGIKEAEPGDITDDSLDVVVARKLCAFSLSFFI